MSKGTQVRPFAATLLDIDKGRVASDAGEQLHSLLDRCLETGKGGSMTLTIKVGIEDADDRRLTVAGQVTVKLPMPEPRKSIAWVDAEGNLTRRDPSQLELDLSPVRAVPAATPATEKAAQ